MRRLQFCIALIVIYATLLAGCSSADKTLREAREASARIQIHTLGIIKANTAAFRAGEIDLDTYAALTHATGKLVNGIKFYRARLKEVEIAYKALKDAEAAATSDALRVSAENATKDFLRKSLVTLSAVFGENVAGVVVDLLSMAHVLPQGPKADEIKAILAGVQLIVEATLGLFAEAHMSLERRELA